MNSKGVFLIIIAFFVSCTLLGQTSGIDGKYTREINTNEGGKIAYNLVLEQDSTFTFTYYRKLATDRAEQTTHCQGSWTLLNAKKIELIANTKLFDTPDFINLEETKAHYITKSPRDKSGRKVPTVLKIYQTNIPWFKGIVLEKQ
ncbi:MAG: hypothetical protein ABJM06_06530 [Gilvibacter sp.]